MRQNIQSLIVTPPRISIENAGTSAVSFKTPKLHLVRPKAKLILTLSIVLGGFLGVATVLTLNAIKSRTPSEP